MTYKFQFSSLYGTLQLMLFDEVERYDRVLILITAASLLNAFAYLD